MREIKRYPIIDKLINRFDSWLKHRQEIREMREFDIGEFARIAHELGVTPDDLDTLVRRGPDAIEELPKLLSASTRRRSHARCRWFSETWSASVRHANTSASAITIS